MPVNLPFHRFKEKQPKHEQEIIWLQTGLSFDSDTINIRQLTVRKVWVEVDNDGCTTGNSICYTKGDEKNPPENHTLMTEFDDVYADDDFLWMDIDRFCNKVLVK